MSKPKETETIQPIQNPPSKAEAKAAKLSATDLTKESVIVGLIFERLGSNLSRSKLFRKAFDLYEERHGQLTSVIKSEIRSLVQTELDSRSKLAPTEQVISVKEYAKINGDQELQVGRKLDYRDTRELEPYEQIKWALRLYREAREKLAKLVKAEADEETVNKAVSKKRRCRNFLIACLLDYPQIDPASEEGKEVTAIAVNFYKDNGIEIPSRWTTVE